MSQLSLMPAHVPAPVARVRLVEVPLPLFDEGNAAPANALQNISEITRVIRADADVRAEFAEFLRGWHRYRDVAKKVAAAFHEQGSRVEPRTISNWLGARNLPDPRFNPALRGIYGPGVMDVLSGALSAAEALS